MAITFIDRPIKNNQSYIKNAQVADERYASFLHKGPQGAVLHSIGTPQPLGEPIAKYFDSGEVEASVHMVLQPDGLCYRLAPDNYRMWHVGGRANNTHLGIEMTEPDCIRYDAQRGYRVHISDEKKALEFVIATYERAVELFAFLCRTYGWNPLEDGVILSHKECHARGMGSNHGDPEHLWDALKTGFTMDTFRHAVAAAMAEQKALEQAPEEKEEYEMRYMTVGDIRRDPKGKFYLPTVEKLVDRGILLGKGGSGDDRVLDLSEDAIRILTILDRAGTFEDPLTKV